MITTTYKGHTITRERMTTEGTRYVFGRAVSTTVNLYSVSGPVCHTGLGCARWTTSVAAAKARINEAIGIAEFEERNAVPYVADSPNT